jgi:hypothetical protein
VVAAARGNPYVWVTWISKVLAGETNCLWSAWFRAHYNFRKLPADFDFENWRHQHSTMVHQQAAHLRSEGWTVYIEKQNDFKLVSPASVTLAGVPDIVAANGEQAVIIDCKTGAPRPFHQYQVLSYMLSLPHARTYSGLPIAGRLVYPHEAREITHDNLDASFRSNFRLMMNLIGGRYAPPRVPSPGECGFCDIGLDDCDEREPGTAEPVPVENLF